MLLVFHCYGYTWAIVNSQVSVYRTIGPTLVKNFSKVFVFLLNRPQMWDLHVGYVLVRLN